MEVEAKIRYSAQPARGIVKPIEDQILVEFEEPGYHTWSSRCFYQ